MYLLGHDVFICRNIAKPLPGHAAHPRPLLSIARGWTERDTEIIVGPWDVIVSKCYRDGTPRQKHS